MRCSTKHLHPFNQAGGVQLYSNTAVPVCRLELGRHRCVENPGVLQDLPECGMHCRPWLVPSSSLSPASVVRAACVL